VSGGRCELGIRRHDCLTTGITQMSCKMMAVTSDGDMQPKFRMTSFGRCAWLRGVAPVALDSGKPHRDVNGTSE